MPGRFRELSSCRGRTRIVLVLLVAVNNFGRGRGACWPSQSRNNPRQTPCSAQRGAAGRRHAGPDALACWRDGSTNGTGIFSVLAKSGTGNGRGSSLHAVSSKGIDTDFVQEKSNQTFREPIQLFLGDVNFLWNASESELILLVQSNLPVQGTFLFCTGELRFEWWPRTLRYTRA